MNDKLYPKYSDVRWCIFSSEWFFYTIYCYLSENNPRELHQRPLHSGRKIAASLPFTFSNTETDGQQHCKLKSLYVHMMKTRSEHKQSFLETTLNYQWKPFKRTSENYEILFGPSRSPDLWAFVFFLRGYLTSEFCAQKPRNIENQIKNSKRNGLWKLYTV